MSYRSSILSDYPLAYYPLDDFTTTSSMGYTDLLAQNNDYQDILTNYETYQDITGTKPLTYAELLLTYGTYADVAAAYASYSNLSGDIAYDHSGSQNNGKYIQRPASGICPIVKGCSTASKIGDSNYIEYTIDKDYTGQSALGKFATVDSYDNDFTIELWFYPQITGNFYTPLFADKTTDHEVGLFYYKGNIVFQVDQQKVDYTIPYKNKAMHIVAIYTPQNISLYINGNLESIQDVSGNPFTRNQVNFKTGPCGISQSFLINSIAVYRYSLSQTQILNHYNSGKGINSSQIIQLNGGEWFDLYDDNTYPVYQYAWPSNKAWEFYLTTDLFYDQDKQYIAIAKTETQELKTIVLQDQIVLPDNEMTSSKIEWDGDNGITVETSDDGITYLLCENGKEIPQYSIDNFSNSRELYIRLTMTTSDANRFNPRLNYLITKFYNDVKKLATNGPSYITYKEKSFNLGRVSSNILWRDARNGLSLQNGASFKLTTTDEIKTIEFFYTPYNLSGAGAIVFAGTTLFSWDADGNIAKANIDNIYVNNYIKTSKTKIEDVFTLNDINYVAITFTNPVTGEIEFNGSSTGAGLKGLYQNIAIYKNMFTPVNALINYNLYRYGNIYTVPDSNLSSFSLTESTTQYYDLEWQRLTNR